MSNTGTYAVVEESGMVRERDAAAGFASWELVFSWMGRNYDIDEIQDKSVRIAYDGPDGRTYEC